ncbi:hypothetical protein [Kutzneria sp. CA-103260]|uniref:hypothetical protein n=1 Tax=Kutzneria sp. CA-103260 TaxID=2802641 RepID=UPI001BA78E01|nr:hypothetical protein [Kutzneria sp. CA-103260]QUQ68822.1 hypothetical protein JJ691_65690 [Kutzneria sp. CA-103260]
MTGTVTDWTDAVRLLDDAEAGAVSESMRRHTPVDGDVDIHRRPDGQAAARQAVVERWPGFAAFVDEIRAILARPPHFAWIRNIPLVQPTVFFVTLADALGSFVEPYRAAWARTMRELRPATDAAREGYGVLNENLHTDGTDWLRPNDLTCLFSVSPDQNGDGRSLLLLDNTRSLHARTPIVDASNSERSLLRVKVML